MRLSERPKCPSTVSTTRRTMTSALHSNWRLLHRMESSKRLKAKNMILSWDYSSIPKTHLNSTNLQEKLWKHSSILRKKVRLNNQSYLFILGGSRESVIPFSANIYIKGNQHVSTNHWNHYIYLKSRTHTADDIYRCHQRFGRCTDGTCQNIGL